MEPALNIQSRGATDSRETQARQASSRFGLGCVMGQALPTDARAWLLTQLQAQPVPPAIAALPTRRVLAEEAVALRETIQRAPDAAGRQAAQADQRRVGFARYRDAVNARVITALQTEAPFFERLVHFWANHFCVSVDNVAMVPFAGNFEFDAIRPHVMGRFEDMLVAVEQHPAMLVYLNQSTSVGPDSRLAAAARLRNAARQRGLNENLAREILELHTLGVRSGYTQADVTEFARALTGWSLDGESVMRAGFSGDFMFRPNAHEPGVRSILGRHYEQTGEDQARAVLHDLARAPATASFIAGKLARHFAGDNPPPALQARLTRAFSESDGDLPAVYRALIDSPEVWQGSTAKFRTPWDWTISALRGFGVRDARQVERLRLPQLFDELGQPVWRPGSPAGWPDTAAAWAAPDAIVRRVEVANRLVEQLGANHQPRALMAQLLGDAPGKATRSTIEGADSQRTALALLLVSPEFMRR